MTTPRKRRRSRKKSQHYFTKKHEEAIVRYSSTEDRRERTKLYVEMIEPAFSEMVDKIIFTYKFTTLPNINPLRDDCKIWLTTILDKFDPSKGSKAFSYFSVITKNWFIHKVKKNSQQIKREVQYDNLPKELESEHMITQKSYETEREKKEFWEHLFEEIKYWDTGNLKENERKVYKAILILFENINDIEIFNKKAVYLYIRELTNLNTKQIVNNLNKMRIKYKHFKKNWQEGKI